MCGKHSSDDVFIGSSALQKQEDFAAVWRLCLINQEAADSIQPLQSVPWLCLTHGNTDKVAKTPIDRSMLLWPSGSFTKLCEHPCLGWLSRCQALPASTCSGSRISLISWRNPCPRQ